MVLFFNKKKKKKKKVSFRPGRCVLATLSRRPGQLGLALMLSMALLCMASCSMRLLPTVDKVIVGLVFPFHFSVQVLSIELVLEVR